MSTPQNKKKDMQAHTGSTPAPAAGGASRSASTAGTASASRSQTVLSLPSGGGALRGIGEKFATNPATGTCSFSIPLPLSPARGARPADPDKGQEATLGFALELSLSYDSGSGNGLFGLGWSVGIPSISRKTDKGLPRYQDSDESDVFLLSGAEDLVPLTDSTGAIIVDDQGAYKVRTYRPRTEGLYALIQRYDQDGRPVFWRTISKDNVTSYFKDTVQEGTDNNRIFSWLLSYSYDDKGNAIEYAYLQGAPAEADRQSLSDAGRDSVAYTRQPVLHRVYYANQHPYSGDGSRPSEAPDSRWLFELAFDFGENEAALGLEAGTPWTMRPDAFSNYRAGFELRTWRLCRRVLLYHHFTDTTQPGHTNYDGVVKSLCFEYDRRPEGTRLAAVQAKGYSLVDGNYVEQSMPVVRFTYTAGTISERLRTLEADSLENLPVGVNGSNYQFADLFGEGSQGILTEQAGGWYYKRNISAAKIEKKGSFLLPKEARFSSASLVPERPAAGLSEGGQLTDLDGDGRQELVHFGGQAPGFYSARNEDESWDRFQPFETIPNIDFNSRDLRFIDLTGDGRSDILLTRNEVFSVFESLGRQGYRAGLTLIQESEDTLAPTVTYSDDHQGIFLADMSGDGLSDIVRVRNGSISYWPNLGYGVFGRRVDMGHAPQLAVEGLFDPKRIRLGDVDGAGPTDLVYLGTEGTYLYRNLSGSAWSDGYRVSAFPPVDSLSSAILADLHGAGTQCLVWSSPLPAAANQPIRYLELFAEGKPNLLASIDNGLGAVTRITYAPSTHFYQCDKVAGIPWATRLHFPVQVVESVEVLDMIARNRFVTRYAYHHGFFDGEEREFRGFGMVEQWDTESYASFSDTGDTWSWDHSGNWDPATHVPPVYTKTWFHTGAFLESGRLEEAYAAEYFSEPGLTDAQKAYLRLPSCRLATDITAVADCREAIRTLRGKPLRIEVYADDAKARYPYQVTENAFQVRQIQKKGQQRHGIFSAHSWQSLELHYERENLASGQQPDPRTVQTMTLELDDFGNELKKLVIQHPRRTCTLPAPLTADAADGWYSKSLFVPKFLYTEQDFTEPVNQGSDWRAPLAFRTTSYQLYRLQQQKAEDIGTSEDPVRFPKPLPPGTNYRPVDADHLFRYESAQAAVLQALAQPIPFKDEFGVQEPALATSPVSRLLFQLVIQYWENPSINKVDEYSHAGIPALVRQQFQLAFDRPTMENAFSGTDFSDAHGFDLLALKGGFLRGNATDWDGFPADEQLWWRPSGITHFNGREDFFQSFSVEDIFGAWTFTDWDAYRMHPVSVTDALENVMHARYDYRVLHPSDVTDPNDCVQLAYYDSLGRVTATVVKGNQAVPTGDGFWGATDISAADVEALLADLATGSTSLAATHLGNATARYIYDAGRFARTSGKEPAISISILREQHVNVGSPDLQCTIAYSDGTGRVIQSKMRAGAGAALTATSAEKYVDGILAGDTMHGEVLYTAYTRGGLSSLSYDFASMIGDTEGGINAEALNLVFRLASQEADPDSYIKSIILLLGKLDLEKADVAILTNNAVTYGTLNQGATASLLSKLEQADIPKLEDWSLLAAMAARAGGLSKGILSYLSYRLAITSWLESDLAEILTRQLAAQATSSVNGLDIVRITAWFLVREGYLNADDFDVLAFRHPDSNVIQALLDTLSITPTEASSLFALADSENWTSVNVAKALFALLLAHGKITATDKTDLDALADSYGIFAAPLLDELLPKILSETSSMTGAYAAMLLKYSALSVLPEVLYEELYEELSSGNILSGCIRLASELLSYKNWNTISLLTLLSDEPLCVEMSLSQEGATNLLLALYRKNVLGLGTALNQLMKMRELGFQDADLMGEVIESLELSLTDTASTAALASIQAHITDTGVDESTYTDLRRLLLYKLPDTFSLTSVPPRPPVTVSRLWFEAILSAFKEAGIISTVTYEDMVYYVYKYSAEYVSFYRMDQLLGNIISDPALTLLRSDVDSSLSISDSQLEQYVGILENHGYYLHPAVIPPFTAYGFVLLCELLTQHGVTLDPSIPPAFLAGDIPYWAVSSLLGGYSDLFPHAQINVIRNRMLQAQTVTLIDYEEIIALFQSDGILPGGITPPTVDTAAARSAFCTSISGSAFLLTSETVAVRWHTSGWQVFNNKGKPVRQYEPFCDSIPEFRPEYSHGASPFLFYDPLGRPIGVLHPDQSWEKTHIGAWTQEVYDVSDTLNLPPATDPVLGTFFRALPHGVYEEGWLGVQAAPSAHHVVQSLRHAGTPTRILLDLAGQPLAHIADNRLDGGTSDDTTTLVTWELKNIQGQRLAVLDPLGKTAVQYTYDMTGNPVRVTTPDAGTVYSLVTADGLPLAHRDVEGRWLLNEYDTLRRPSSVRLRLTLDATSEQEISRMEYTDTAGHDSSELALLKSQHLLGRVARMFDTAGMIRTERYDRQGNSSRSFRQYVEDYRQLPDWLDTGEALLMPGSFYTTTEYDALGRPYSKQDPTGTVLAFTYAPEGHLRSIRAMADRDTDWRYYLSDVEYNARGQRIKAVYGNGIRQKYEYDPRTFRLTRLYLYDGRPSGTAIYQDLNYTYEVDGNVSTVQDLAQPATFLGNTAVESLTTYGYDSIGRLIEAKGREHIGQVVFNDLDNAFDAIHLNLPPSSSTEAFRSYTQDFTYDKVGNLLSLQHQGNAIGSIAATGYTRNFHYDTVRTNRLASTTVTGRTAPYEYGYTPAGSINQMPHLQEMGYDLLERLAKTVRQVVTSGTAETTYYLYDMQGNRVRKVTDRYASGTPTRKNERLYLGDCEIYWEYAGDGTTITHQRLTDHISDEHGRFAMQELSDSQILLRYNHADPLESSRLETDALGRLIAYEEYHAYGTTAYQATLSSLAPGARRYRYAGKERDEESGLYYFGARYYAPWLGRFLSVDPKAGEYIHQSTYCYAANNPVTLKDVNGEGPGDGEEPKVGDVRYTQQRQSHAANGEILTVPEGATYATVYAGKDTKGMEQWLVGGFQLKNGDRFNWDPEKKWYVNSDGMEYDQPLIYDISNGVGKVVAPLIQMASDYVNSGNPFSSIMAAKGGASWASFISSSLWSGVKSTVEEVQAGGHRRSQALLTVGAGVLSSGGNIGSEVVGSSVSSTLSYVGRKVPAMVTTSEGFLIGGVNIRAPFNIPVQRFGELVPGTTQHWGLRLGGNRFVNRTFAAILPEWNPLTTLNQAYIPKGTMMKVGIVGPQKSLWIYPGGSVQFFINSSNVQSNSIRYIAR